MEELFQRSVARQIAMHQARTPTQRMEAFCQLLDAIREMSPMDPDSVERRKRAYELRQKEREEFRAKLKQLRATGRLDSEYRAPENHVDSP